MRIIRAEHMDDLFGRALLDFYQNVATEPLILHTTYGPPETVPLKRFFQDETEFSDLDYYALEQVRGCILDIGAGTGRQALSLQKHNTDITTMDISPSCVRIMEQSGLKKIIQADVFHYNGKKFDTLLMLMNGIGIAGDLDGIKRLLIHLKTMINPGGQLLLDSSDIRYLYEKGQKPKGNYFGELTYRYEYKKQLGAPFQWIYIDQKKLIDLAKKTGWNCQIIFEDESDAYLARLQTR